MYRLISFIILIVSSSSFANYYDQNCRSRYRVDNFYLSAGKTFDYDISAPEIYDNVCWMLGDRYAQRVLNKAEEERDLDDCYEAFDEGYAQGMEATQSDMEYPQYCYNLGFRFGLSLLSTSAREGNFDIVGDDCIEEYNKGLEAALNNRPITVRPNNKLAYCYRTGYGDGQNVY